VEGRFGGSTSVREGGRGGGGDAQHAGARENAGRPYLVQLLTRVCKVAAGAAI